MKSFTVSVHLFTKTVPVRFYGLANVSGCKNCQSQLRYVVSLHMCTVLTDNCMYISWLLTSFQAPTHSSLDQKQLYSDSY